MFSATLSEAGVSAEFVLRPGQSVDYAATTADLAFGSLYLEQSRDGLVFEPARDSAGDQVETLVGDEGEVSVAAVLRNEGTRLVRYRVRLVDTSTGEEVFAGSVDVEVTDRADRVTAIEDVADLTDEGVTFRVPVTGTVIVPEYADNATALAAGAPIGSLYSDGAGAVAAVVAE